MRQFTSRFLERLAPWLFLAFVVPAAIPCEDSLGARPNVLLIVTDDQRPDTIHVLGNAHIRTPNLDHLARQGTAFTRAVSAYPICTPSRAEILSGCTAFRNGVLDFGRKLDQQLILLPQAFRQAGYSTWYCGKWHNDGRPTQRGYDATRGLFAGGGRKFWKPTVDYRGHPVTGYVGWIFQTDDGKLLPELGVGLTTKTSQQIADAAISVLRQPHRQPFFLHVNFTAPHDPLILPPEPRHRYDPARIPLPPNFLPQHPFDHGNLHGRDEELLPFPRTEEIVRADIAAYYSVISQLDEQIGRILGQLRELQLDRNTIVVYTSDHGLAMGSHGLRGKQNMYEHTIGVPMIVAGPTIPANERRMQQVYLRDIYPTLCALTGIDAPQDLDGRSFAPALTDKHATTHAFTVAYFRNFQRMIRTDRYKLIEYPEVKRRQLFDLRADPLETHNLIDEPQLADIRDRMTKQLRQWQIENHDPLAP